MTDSIDVKTNWLDPQTLNDVRGQVPLVYVDAVPVRVNDMGEVTHVGMLLRCAKRQTDPSAELWFLDGFCWANAFAKRFCATWKKT